MEFEVQFPVTIISIVSNDTYVQSKYITPGVEPAMRFTVTYETYQMQTGWQTLTSPNTAELSSYGNITIYYNTTVLETVSAFDHVGAFIGMASIWKLIPVTVSWNVPVDWTDTFVIYLTTYAVVGQGTAYADAFSQAPNAGGAAYCPEAYTTIKIVAPP
jgi:hypothetical protein